MRARFGCPRKIQGQVYGRLRRSLERWFLGEQRRNLVTENSYGLVHTEPEGSFAAQMRAMPNETSKIEFDCPVEVASPVDAVWKIEHATVLLQKASKLLASVADDLRADLERKSRRAKENVR